MVCSLDVHSRDVVRQQHYLVCMKLVAVLAPQIFAPDQSALDQPRHERPRPRERVDDVDARVSERRAEFLVQDILHATDDVVHNLHWGIDDTQTLRSLWQRLCQEPLVQFRNDTLLARSGRHAFCADSHVSVESFQTLGLLFKAAVVQSVHHLLHGARDRVSVGKGVVLEQRVENWLRNQMLGERPNSFVLAHAIV